MRASDAVSRLLLWHLRLSHRRSFPSTCPARSHVRSSVGRGLRADPLHMRSGQLMTAQRKATRLPSLCTAV